MKELIIEEKARAYDYALAKARDMLSYKEVRREDIEYLFPELIESEDEKIRKELIDYHRSMAAGADDYMHEAWIAWLEKQKEYESTDFDYVWETTDCSQLTSALDKYSENAIKKVCHAWYDKGIELERKNWLEKQGEIDKVSYEIAEKEKREFVGNGFIECYADFQDFEEGETYWLEYLGNDNYSVRSDNLLAKTYHITPGQLYTVFKMMADDLVEKQRTSEETNAPTGYYGKYVDECLNEASKHFFSEGEDKYSVADLFYAGVRCGQSWLEKQGEQDNWAEELNTKIKELHKQCLEKIQEYVTPCLGKMSEEDERIRKEIINLINDLWKEKQGLMTDRKDYERYIDWLKKQGKKQPIIVWHSINEEPEEMKELFCDEHGIDYVNGKYTVNEFISLTRDAYGGIVIRQLEDSKP